MTTSDPSSNGSSMRRAVLALGVAALLGLTLSFADTDTGTVHASDTCTNATPGASNYCASSECGPCLEGEGDCDPGQCGPGLECVEEGAIDRCRPEDSCTASPGAGDYCSSSQCGPCGEGEGDCDPGQCGPGLECVEEGSVDRCRAVEEPPDGTCTAASPGSSSYCAANKCGPCLEGEGDCDAGQCGEGLECVDEGSVDRCRPIERPCEAGTPGAMDYCSSDVCGVCAEGEGDCEPGQCGGGLTCVEEGSVDRCRPVGERRLQVQLGGTWTNVCCVNGVPMANGGDCWWTEAERVLTDRTAGKELDCPESALDDCACDGSGEKMHGYNGGAVTQSLDANGGGPMYGDYKIETCVYVDARGVLSTQVTSASCPKFQLE